MSVYQSLAVKILEVGEKASTLASAISYRTRDLRSLRRQVIISHTFDQVTWRHLLRLDSSCVKIVRTNIGIGIQSDAIGMGKHEFDEFRKHLLEISMVSFKNIF